MEIEEQIQSEISSEDQFLPSIDFTSDLPLTTIKEEFSFQAPNSYDYENTPMETFYTDIKSEFLDEKFDIIKDDGNHMKLESLLREELELKNEIEDEDTTNLLITECIREEHSYSAATHTNIVGSYEHTKEKNVNFKIYEYQVAVEGDQHITTCAVLKCFKCNLCDYKCDQEDQLQAHLTDHIIKAAKHYKCNLCEYICTQNVTLQNHLKTHNVIEEKPFKCTICNDGFDQNDQLTDHILKATEHNKCNTCENTCKENITLQNHLKNNIKEDKPFKCDICDYKCKWLTVLKLHYKTHTGGKPFKCVFCDYKAIWKRNLTMHMKTHMNDKRFVCSICDYKCIEKRYLYRHMISHTSSKSQNLEEFLKTHVEIKPFKCGLCGFRTREKLDLQQHMSSHEGMEF